MLTLHLVTVITRQGWLGPVVAEWLNEQKSPCPISDERRTLIAQRAGATSSALLLLRFSRMLLLRCSA